MMHDWPVILRMKHGALDPEKLKEFTEASRPYMDARRDDVSLVVKTPLRRYRTYKLF